MSRLLNSWYKQQQASRAYRRGLTYVCQMSHGKAIAAFSEAVERGWQHAGKALVKRGISHSHLNDLPSAIADFDGVIETSQAGDTTLAEAHYHRGLLRQQAGNEAGALADWSAAVAHWPTYPEPHYHRALVALGQGHYEQALADLDIALAANPTMVMAYLHRGNLRHQLGDIPGAVADWELAVCNDFSLEAAKQKLASVQQADYDAKLSLLLEAPLAALGLRAEVNHSGATLDIHIYRELGTGVNYYTLPDVIREHLVPLHLADVSRFQLIGHLAEVNRPEWSQFYDLYKGQPCPPSHWQTAFSALVLFPPFGIPAFIQAARVKALYKKGHYLEAVGASKAVKGLCVAGSVTLGFFTLLPLG
ncbi:MAG: tetratricopeptide repeat protein, partial [Cyanobacteria bacterium J06598_3]